MRNIYKLFIILLSVVFYTNALAQQRIVKFTGRDRTNQYRVQLDRVEIFNLDQLWEEVLYWPDTTLMMGTVGVEDYENQANVQLMRNVPNPFNGRTEFALILPEGRDVRLEIFDMTGKFVVGEDFPALSPGTHLFEAILMSPQTYLLSATVYDGRMTLKMINEGHSGMNAIRYLGMTDLDGDFTVYLKDDRASGSYPFAVGDEMKYTGFTTIDGTEMVSNTVIQKQYDNEIISLLFDVSAPLVNTIDIIDLTDHSATIHYEVTDDGGTDVIERGVCLNTVHNPTISDSCTSEGDGLGQFYSIIEDLMMGTTYYARAYATNVVGTAYGTEISFTTNTTPSITTEDVTYTTSTTAVCGGTITTDGGDWVTARGVCWSTSPLPTIDNDHTLNGTGIGNFTSLMTGLSMGTTYYVRAYAQNSSGIAYGEQKSFTTLDLPSVITYSVSDIASNSATCGGQVVSDGGATVTERGVCWSTSPNPTLIDNHIVNGSGTGYFTSNITGLTPNTTYYVRAYATNSVGTTYGDPMLMNTLCNGIDTSIYVTACENYTWHDIAFTQSTIYNYTFDNEYGCPCVERLHLTVSYKTYGDTVATACESFVWHGVEYTENTNSTYTLVNGNVHGCDSIVTLHLTIKHSSTGIDVQEACDSYTWIDGNTYFENTNTPTYILTNAAGCDSIVTLHLTIKHSTTGVDEQEACDSYTWIDGNTYYASTNTPTYNLTNAVGCDSIVTLHLTIKHSTTGIDVHEACDSYTWIDGNTYYASTNTPTYILTNTIGCDSIVTLHLTIKNSTTGIDVQEACDSYTWIDGNTYFASASTPTYILTNAAGCDSVVTLNLTIFSSDTLIADVTVCDYYFWNDSIYDQTGDYIQHFQTTHGCDSTVILHLTVYHSTDSAIYRTACDSYTWNDFVYTVSGDYVQSFSTIQSCDSIVTLHLTIRDSSFDTIAPVVSPSAITHRLEGCGVNLNNCLPFETLGDFDQAGIVVNDDVVELGDNCGLSHVTITHTDTYFYGDCGDTLVRVYTFTDNGGNTATFTHIFIAHDSTAPSFVATNGSFPYVRLFPVEAGNCTFNSPDSMDFVNAVAPFVHDNCTDSAYLMSTLVFNWENIAESPIGATNIFSWKNHLTVEATITDRCNNSTKALIIYLDRPDKLHIEQGGITSTGDQCFGETATLTFDPAFIFDDTITGPFVPHTYTWSEVNGKTVSFSAATALETNVTFPEPGDYTFQITVTDRNGCVAVSEPISLNVRALPVMTINHIVLNGQSEPYCPTYGNLIVEAEIVNPVAGQTVDPHAYVWTGESVNTMSDSSLTWVTIVPEWCDTVYYPTVTVTDDRGCMGSVTDTIEVKANGPEFIGSIPDTTVVKQAGCVYKIPDFKNLINASIVKDDCYTFSQLKYSNAYGTIERTDWYTQSPAAGTELTTNFKVVTITIKNPCGKTTTLNVNVLKPQDMLTVSIDPDTAADCQVDIENVGVDYTTTVENSYGTVTYAWALVGSTTPLTNNTNASYTAVGAMAPGSYTYQVDIEDSLGCTASATAQLTVYFQGANPYYRTWSNTLCDRYNGTLAVDTAPRGYTYTLEHQVYGNPQTKISNPPAHMPTDWTTIVFDSLRPGYYDLTIYTTDGCERTHVIFIDDISTAPAAPTYTKGNVTVCTNNNGTLNINAIAGFTYELYRYDGNVQGEFLGTNTSYDNLLVGRYLIHATQNATHCVSEAVVDIDDDSQRPVATWTIPVANKNCVNAGGVYTGQIKITSNASYQYTVYAVNGMDTTWYLNNELLTATNNPVKDLKDGSNYYVEVYDPATGCSSAIAAQITIGTSYNTPNISTTTTPNHYCVTTNADGKITFSNASSFLSYVLYKGADSIADKTSDASVWNTLYNDTYRIEAIANDYCPKTKDNIVVISNTITPAIDATSTMNTSCVNDLATITLKNTNASTMNIYPYGNAKMASYKIEKGSFVIDTATTATQFTFNNVGSGTYNYTATTNYGCVKTGIVTVQQYQLPAMQLDSTPNHMCAPTFEKPGDGTVTVVIPTTETVPGAHFFRYYFYDANDVNMDVPYELPLTNTKHWLAAKRYHVVAVDTVTGCTSEGYISVENDFDTVDFDYTTTPNYICGSYPVGNGSITVVNATSTNPDAVLAYSLDNVTYTLTPTFTGLKDSTYTVYVKDMVSECVEMKQVPVNPTDSCAPVVDAKSCPAAPTVTDHEGNVYATVQIGDQCWMRDNLRTTTSPSTGTYLIPTAHFTSTYTGKQARWYNNDSATYAPMNYGLLYNWNAAVDTFNTAYGETSVNISSSNAVSVSFTGHRRGICPAGWHVPSNSEWTELTLYVEGQSNFLCGINFTYIAKALASTTGWNSSTVTCAVGNTSVSNNATGFGAVHAGHTFAKSFFGSGDDAHFWSSTEYSSSHAANRELNYNDNIVISSSLLKEFGHSVRCLRDYDRAHDTTVVIDAKSCPATPTVTDHEGNVYATVQIGDQCWMRDNLRTTTSPTTGTYLIPATNVGRTYTGKQARWFNNDSATYAPMNYGLLYNWNAAVDTFNTALGETSVNTNDSNAVAVSFTGYRRGICPAGWHLPSDAEWTQLTDYVKSQSEYTCGGNINYIGKALSSSERWNSYSGECYPGDQSVYANNATCFSAVPVGFCIGSSFDYARRLAAFWSSTETSSGYACTRKLYNSYAHVNWGNYTTYYGLSVRCLRDAGTEPVISLLTVTTAAVSDITATSATLHGTISNPDNVTIIAQGFQWKASQGVTYTTVSATGAEMSYNLTGLATNTDYTYRAFVTTGEGTSYGDEVTFSTFEITYLDAHPCPGTPTVTDVDGNVYNTVQIGGQCWMKENLRTTKYANGISITQWIANDHMVGCWSYPNSSDSTLKQTYGLLYDWKAVMKDAASSDACPSGVQGVCPTGWHVPSEVEWTILTDYISNQSEYMCGDNSSNIAKALAYQIGWDYSSYSCSVGYDESSNNATGFGAMPVGLGVINYCPYLHRRACFWTSTERSTYTASGHFLYYEKSTMESSNSSKSFRFSVRCLRDEGNISMFPIVTTNTISNVGSSSATSGGSATTNSGAIITARGVCWSIEHNPTVKDPHTADGDGTGSFTSSITGLASNITYHVRAYATNQYGTVYGNEVTFTTTINTDGDVFSCQGVPTVTDTDGNIYNTVQIGGQCWMRENLKATRYADGTSIPQGDGYSYSVGYWNYLDSDSSYKQNYGLLYNWKAVMREASATNATPSGVQGVCPTGWHVPSDDEWTILMDYVSGQNGYVCGINNTNIAKALASRSGWVNYSSNCVVGNDQCTNNATGFGAMPASEGSSFGYYALFWSTSEKNNNSSYIRYLYYSNSGVHRSYNDKSYLYSVRCLRDEGSAFLLPSVTTNYVSNIGSNTANCGGNISDNGGASVTARGVCWSTSQSPTISDSHTTDGSGTGSFTSSITGLSAGTTYYVRAYATNSACIAYGAEMSFTTLSIPVVIDEKSCPAAPTVTDHEGNVYATVKIGNQCWMRDNLRATTSPSTGTYLIPAAGTGSTYTGKQARWYYNDSTSYAPMNYGLLYNWNAAVDTFNTAYGETSVNSTTSNAVSMSFTGHRRGICPAGWHLPSDAEWTQLTNYVKTQDDYICGDTNINIAKPLASTEGWFSYIGYECMVGIDQTANNATGFSAVPAGYCYGSSFGSAHNSAEFWSSSQYYSGGAYSRELRYISTYVDRGSENKANGFSVRCLRDAGNTSSLPTVTTNTVASVTSTSAICGGNVTNNGSSAVTARGVCWSTLHNPTISGNHTTNGSDTGSFTSSITGLSAGTTYYVRAYATNSAGTAYGAEVSLTTLSASVVIDAKSCPATSTVTDHEGNVYATVQIGGQCWMRDNLRTTTSPSTGTYLIPAAGTSYTYTGKQARWYNNDSATYAPMNYGLLYNWNAAVDTFNTSYGETSVNSTSGNAVSVSFTGHRRGICPAGWHLPSDAEWTQLTNYVKSQSEYTCGENSNNIGKALASETGWNSYSGECYPGDQSVHANNATGFSAVPAGYCFGSSFYDAGYFAYFWSSSQYESYSNRAVTRNLYCDNATVYRNNSGKSYGRSVRCLRD